MATDTGTVRGLGSGSLAAPAAPRGALGKDDFLKLFLAQLGYQDPTAPTDTGAFIAQLAQFSSIEQLQRANDRLDSLLVAQAGANATGAAGLAGRDVTWRSSRVVLGTAGASLRGELGADAATVTWTITDSAGRTVRTISSGAAKAGGVDAAWDGRDDRGVPLPPGEYGVKVVAAAADGTAIDAGTRGWGRVEAVTFEAGYPQLLVDGETISMSDVTRVAAP